MWPFDALASVLLKPKVAGWTAFFAYALCIWLLKDFIIALLLVPDTSTVDVQQMVARTEVVIWVLMVGLMGVIIYAISTQDTITQRAQMIAQHITRDISLSHEHLQTLYENSPVPYFLMDDVGAIHNPNKAAIRFLGGTKEECEVMNMYQCLARGASQGNTAVSIQEKIERNFPISREEVLVRNFKGEDRWALMSVYSLVRNPAVPLRHLVTLIDMTEEKETERVKSDFLLLASHQLRTPMTTIKWYTDYLLHTPSIELAADVRQYLEEIDSGNERMIELVNTLLTVSRLEMGTLAPEYVPIHINEVVADILKELEPDIKKRGTRVAAVTRGDDKLITDRVMVRISIHNLLTNAIKYTPQGGSVSITCEFGATGCVVAVVDGGCGIPITDQEKIFTKMFRASNARKISSAGTGLGLHLTRSFVQKLGGTIRFVSEEGKGSTFTITLPRVAPEA